MLTPGCLCIYSLTTGDRTYRILARFLGVRPQDKKKMMVMFPQGDGRGHVTTVIRPSVQREKITPLEEYFRQREIERLRHIDLPHLR